jgi:hypothetical protein
VEARPAEVPASRHGWWSEGYWRFTAFCILVTAAVAAIDTATKAILIGLLAIGPCMAIATRRALPTALVGALATGASIALAVPDGIWGTHLELEYCGAVAVVAVMSVVIAALAERRPGRRGFGAAREGSNVDFLITAYGGVLDRAPDRDGLAHQLHALQNGETREQLLRGMVRSPEAAMLALYQRGTRDLVADFWSRGTAARRMAQPLCFLHTMKTAGTSLRHALGELAAPWPCLAELFVDDLVCAPSPLLDHAMFIAGHLPYEALDLLPPGLAVCTVVRDPVERTLSHLAHLNSRVLAERGQEGISVEEFVWSPLYHPLWQNYQARQLVHRIGLRDAWRSFSPAEQAQERGIGGPDAEYPLQSLFDSTPLTLTGDALAVAALERLDSIEFVGTTERLDSLVARVAAFWHRPAPAQVPFEGASASRVEAAHLSGSLLAAVKTGTAADAALYERASAVAARGDR